MIPEFFCANVVAPEIDMSQHPRRRHYAAFIATGEFVVFVPIDLNINHLERVQLPLRHYVACGRCWKSAEGLENIFVYQKAESVARWFHMAIQVSALDPGLEFLAHGFWCRTVQVAVLDDYVGISLPDFVGSFVILRLGAGAGMGGLDLFETLVLDPLVDDVQSSCESGVRAKGEDCSPDGEAPAIYQDELISIQKRTVNPRAAGSF